jgi:hypothetical protein
MLRNIIEIFRTKNDEKEIKTKKIIKTGNIFVLIV